jgi:hypothetical protein
MGSILFASELPSEHEPVPPAFQPASTPTRKSAVRGRFMGSDLFASELPSEHEPENRKCLQIRGAILRFMGSDLFLFELPREHEPGRVGGAAGPPLAA